MTERAEKALKRASTIIALSLTVISIIVGGYKVVDTSNRAIALAEVVQARIETERTERQSADMVLDKAIMAERESRNAEYTQIQVKLTEIDTHLVYIRQALDGGR